MTDKSDVLLDDCHLLRNVGRPGYEYLMDSRRVDESMYPTAPTAGQYDASKPANSAYDRPPSSGAYAAPSTSPPSGAYGNPSTSPPSSGHGTPTSPPSNGYGSPTTSSPSGYGKPANSPSSGYGKATSTPTSPPSSGYGKSTSPPSGYGKPTSPPSSGYGKPTSPPSSGYDRPTSPPSSGYGKPTSPPSSGYDRPTSRPSNGYDRPTSPPSNGYGRPTSPPSSGYGKPTRPPSAGYGRPTKAPSDKYGKPSGDKGRGARYDGNDGPGSPGKGKPSRYGDDYGTPTKTEKPSSYGSTEPPCESLKPRPKYSDSTDQSNRGRDAKTHYRESLVEEAKPSQCGDCTGCYSGASGTCLGEYSPRLCWTAGLTWCGAPAAPPAPTPANWDNISWGPKPEWAPFGLEWPPRASYFTDSYSYADGEWVEAGDSPAQTKSCTPDPRYEHLSRPAWYPPQLSWPPLSCGDFWDTAPAPPTSLALTDRGLALLKTNMVPLVSGCALVVVALGVAFVRRSLRRHRERREQELYEDNSHYQPLL
ncbi:hypothetical protein SDRG_14197 [Saprolegnia diclina VS20]|uniref:Mucin-like domain-containing protein n=1 Tax=Saprolegnia diclina (strain VS20) TaxID=1156394 RepID=T0Q3V7_SAPDV|nr:hypothetical protein SDRG_14197 [Saprolegnia diclina VS20]EQC28105.1 hypothetical protein SDRG_14197 [Saprolegnia diclina VS20]|eukprot:XP_008618530.1 hypothetical protein SDRG_14197 [Saprolegnia diclina VS20]